MKSQFTIHSMSKNQIFRNVVTLVKMGIIFPREDDAGKTMMS